MSLLTIIVTMLFLGNPKTLETEEFLLQWEHQDDYVNFSLTAPTNGWIAIGFTENEDIIDSNLIMMKVNGEITYAEDQYIIGFGKHSTVESLGVKSRISKVNGKEAKGETTVSFTIIKEKLDKYHFNLSEGREINVWLAWSISDDFDHHSRKRILRKITL